MKKRFIVLILFFSVFSFLFVPKVKVNAAAKAAPTESYQKARAEANGEVMIAPTGKKYHIPRGCRTVKGEYKIITLAQAQRLGYTACGVCNPSNFLKIKK